MIHRLSCALVAAALTTPACNGASAPSKDPGSSSPGSMGAGGSKNAQSDASGPVDASPEGPVQGEAGDDDSKTALANVERVEVTGSPNSFTFSVTVSSPDTGCKQFADWWEVLSEDGELLYRRILLHSHVNEQPFTRTGGPVAIESDTHVWVRAHLSLNGSAGKYGGQAFFGSTAQGFTAKPEPTRFDDSALATQDPQPTGCAF